MEGVTLLIGAVVRMFSGSRQSQDRQPCPESQPPPSSGGEEEEEETYEEGQEVEEETPEEEEVKVEWPTGVPQASDKDLAKLSVKEGVSLGLGGIRSQFKPPLKAPNSTDAAGIKSVKPRPQTSTLAAHVHIKCDLLTSADS